jgi:hypothetical protein
MEKRVTLVIKWRFGAVKIKAGIFRVNVGVW